MFLFADGSLNTGKKSAAIGGFLAIGERRRMKVIYEYAIPLIPYVGGINVIEYEALIHGIQRAAEYGADVLVMHTDSQVVQCQVTGEYATNAPHLKTLRRRFMDAASKIQKWEIHKIPREQNTLADALASSVTGRQSAVNALHRYRTGGAI